MSSEAVVGKHAEIQKIKDRIAALYADQLMFIKGCNQSIEIFRSMRNRMHDAPSDAGSINAQTDAAIKSIREQLDAYDVEFRTKVDALEKKLGELEAHSGGARKKRGSKPKRKSSKKAQKGGSKRKSSKKAKKSGSKKAKKSGSKAK